MYNKVVGSKYKDGGSVTEGKACSALRHHYKATTTYKLREQWSKSRNFLI